jgi:tripartite-type tricarboxylate transporter receptor subunit TctC
MRLIVPYPPPSSFDTYARLVARHMPRHIPGNPSIIVQTVPGAGGLNAVQTLANAAPRDGSTLATMNSSNVTDPMINPETSKFDPRKFAWIGSVNAEGSACAFWSDKVKTMDDLRDREIVIGGTGPAAGSTVESRALQSIFGFNFRIVHGYPAQADVRFAAAKGEIDGHCALLVSTLKTDLWDGYKAGRIKVVIQAGVETHPDIPEVPNAFELAKAPEDLAVLKLVFTPWAFGRPIVAPPDTPADRVEVLRAAFERTMRDRDFIDEIRKLNLEHRPISGQRAASLVEELFKSPQAVIERVRKMTQGP